MKHHVNLWLLEGCALSCLLDRRVAVLHAVEGRLKHEPRMKLNSCAHPQKQRICRRHVCIFISMIYISFVTSGTFPGAGWLHFVQGMSSRRPLTTQD